MKKLALLSLAALAVALCFPGLALAADQATVTAALDTVSKIALASAIGIAFGVFGPALAQGLAVFGSTTGIARNPEAAGTIRTAMILGLALIESLAIYALVVVLLLIYAFPYRQSVLNFLAG
jgi:F-type H+-transporting ATPase subunit c